MTIKGTIGYRSGLGACAFEGFAASFISAFLHLEKELPGPYYFMRGLGCILHDNANQFYRNFKGDWFLMCDTDHVFQSDAFVDMVTTFEDNNLDILTGFMQSRQPPYRAIIFNTTFDPFKPSDPINPAKYGKYDLIPFDASGAGSLMIRRRVIDAMLETGERPFDLRYKFHGPSLVEKHPEGVWKNLYESEYQGRWKELSTEGGYHWDDMYWEDYSFFWRAKILGFKAFCAPWIKFHHIEKRMVTDDLLPENQRAPLNGAGNRGYFEHVPGVK